jgi:hypothetical protein
MKATRRQRELSAAALRSKSQKVIAVSGRVFWSGKREPEVQAAMNGETLRQAVG